MARNDIEELRAGLFEIGSIQKSEENETGHLPVKMCCEVSGATGKPSLCEAQKIGKKKLKAIVFPLFSTHGREVWSYVMFLFTLGLVTRSAVCFALNFVNDKKTVIVVDYVDLGLSSVSCVLAFLDFAIIICSHRCRLARDACNKCRGAEDAEMQAFLAPQQGTAADEENCCSNILHKYADLLRMILFDILVYAITICLMFKTLRSTIHNNDDGSDIRSIKLISIFAGQTLVSVIIIYGIRMFVIGRIIFLIHKVRKNGPMEKSGRWFHIHFFLHMIGQMVSQVVMVVLIGVKFYSENIKNSSADPKSTDSTIQINYYLWYMIVSGSVIPFLGVFTYIIGNYYSVDEYPIGFFFDLLLTKCWKCSKRER